MTDKQELHRERQRNPINKEKYVRDKIRYGSKQTAIKKQKPFYAPSTANAMARKLEDDPVVQRLSEGIEQRMIELNAQRLAIYAKGMDSEDIEIALKAADSTSKVIDKYQDRTLGRPKQSVEVKSTKVTISLDMSGGAVSVPRDVLEMDDANDS